MMTIIGIFMLIGIAGFLVACNYAYRKRMEQIQKDYNEYWNRRIAKYNYIMSQTNLKEG